MIVVLDASAAVGIVLQSKTGIQLTETVREADLVLAPSLFVSEITNTFWKYTEFHDWPLEKAEQAVEKCVQLPDHYSNDGELYREVLMMSCTMSHPAYDLYYVVLARRNNATMLTL